MSFSPVCIGDFEHYLQKNTPEKWFHYYSNGADDEQTLHDNILAFQRYRLRPRCLRDVSKRDTRCSILGHDLEFPVGVSPTAFHSFLHKDGEIGTAKAVASVGSAMILSMWSNTSLEDVAASVSKTTLLMMQINVDRDRLKTKRIVERAETAGYKALVVTVDQPMTGKQLESARQPVDVPPQLPLPHILMHNQPVDSSSVIGNTFDSSLTWADIKWLQGVTSLPIILKGILTAEDAEMAVKHGVAGILVSNHGGRQLDGVPATIDALSEVERAVRGSRVELYLDGGLRKGTDVLKALAMGARAVFIGRPVLWGLAYDGEAGVKKVLEILKDEYSLAMALSGCSSMADISHDLITRQPYSNL